MLKTYLILAFRQLRKHTLYSAINIAGLSVGIAIVLVLGCYLYFETSYETSHEKADRLYQVNSNLYWESFDAFAAYDLGPAIQQSIPGVKNVMRKHWGYGELKLRDDDKTKENGDVWFADNLYFEMFSFKAVAGDLSTSLKSPYSIVLSKSLATRLFKDPKEALGKTIEFNGDYLKADLTVTAVAEDAPKNTGMGFNALVSIDPLLQSKTYKESPRWANFFTYVELENQDALSQANAALPRLVNEYTAGEKIPYKTEIFLQPIRWMHLSHSDPRQGQDLGNIYLLSIIAIIVLAVAWVNYVNLSTARAIERAREVGVKKALGVLRKDLIMQFLLESFVVNGISLSIAIVLAVAFMPLMNDLSQQNLSLDFSNPTLLTGIASLLIFGTVISGLYPAFVLSSFRTTEVIKGVAVSQPMGFSLRKSLLVFQFATSLSLLIATMAIVQQVRFMESQDTGVKTEQVLVIPGPDQSDHKDEERAKSFKNSIKQLPSVENVSTSGVVPGGSYNLDTHLDFLGKSEEEGIYGANTMIIFSDMDFIETYQFKLLEGSNWNPDNKGDYDRIIINEATVAAFKLGTNKDAVGQKVVFDKHDTAEVIGVVKNFYWESMKVSHRPVVISPLEIYPRRTSILMKGDFENTINAVRELYRQHFPGTEFNYYFANDYYDRLYESDVRFGSIFGVFSIFAISVACLGLFGMATFTTYQRAREISIRKVLGASVVNIMTLLSTQFGKLMLIAIALSIPLSWFVVSKWLENYPIRIEVSVWLFIVPSILLLMLLSASVIVQVYRGANINPARVLRG
jgi:putative ABC transport system permease protein